MRQLKLSGIERCQWDGDVRSRYRTRERLVGTRTEPTLFQFSPPGIKRAAVGCLATRQQLQAGCDVVNVVSQMLRHVVLVASYVLVSGSGVFIVIVFGFQEALSFVDLSIELNPLLVDRMRDASRINAGIHNPVIHAVDLLLCRSENVMDLFSGVPFSILR